MVDVQDIPYFTEEVDVQDLQDFPTNLVDELELSDIHLIEQYILDKEERDAQEIEECIVELPDKQEIDIKMLDLPKMLVKISCEQEECIEEDIFIRSLSELPELCKAKASMHEDGIQLETPKLNTTEVSELPREIKLEMSIEQDKSKLHPKQKKVLGSKVIKRENPIKVIKGETCRPPPKPPDRENSLNLRHETKKGRVRPYKNKKESQEAQRIDRELNYRPSPKLLFILDTNGEVIGIIENVVPKSRPL